MEATDFQPRASQLTPLFTKAEDCDCPSGRTRWFILPCPSFVAGQVTDGRTGEPLDNITIWFEGAQTGNCGYAVTDAAGRYSIGPLLADSCCLIAQGPGYSYCLLENGTFPKDGLVQNIKMVRLGVIQGVLTNNNGQPIQGASISLFQQDYPHWGREEAVTNEDGEYCICSVNVSRVGGLNGSTYEFRALHPNYSFAEAVFPIFAHYNGQSTLHLDTVMPQRAIIQGTVSSNNSPLMDAVVGISEDSNSLLGEHYDVLTNFEGNYLLKVNAPATYTLFTVGDQTSTAKVTVNVTPGVTMTQNFTVLPPGQISGRVGGASGEPMSGILIEVMAHAEDMVALVELTCSPSSSHSEVEI